MLVLIAFIRHLQGFLGKKCVIRQFLAYQDLIVDMIFEWLEFLAEVQTEKKTEKVPQKTEKKTEKTQKIPKNRKQPKKPNATANFKFGTGFFSVFFVAGTIVLVPYDKTFSFLCNLISLTFCKCYLQIFSYLK